MSPFSFVLIAIACIAVFSIYTYKPKQKDVPTREEPSLGFEVSFSESPKAAQKKATKGKSEDRPRGATRLPESAKPQVDYSSYDEPTFVRRGMAAGL